VKLKFLFSRSMQQLCSKTEILDGYEMI